MTSEERKVIKDLKKCDFKEMHAHFMKVRYYCISSMLVDLVWCKSLYVTRVE